MKKFFLAVISLFISGFAVAQQGFQEQINEIKGKTDKFNAYFNFQSSFDAVTEKEQDTHLGFKARQLRLEFRGNINENIFYRFRHRLNRSNAGTDLDNLARATDIMYAGFRLNDRWTLTAGKMCQAWGGFEFDLNPMNIYEYSDFVDNMDNFMLGAMATYTPSKEHEWNFQITNSRNSTFNSLYENTSEKPSNAPLTYIVNWNGNLLNNTFQTRWAFGYEQESKNNSGMMVMLGNKLNFSNFQIFLDYMYAYQGIDRLKYAGIYTNVYGISHNYPLRETSYSSFVCKAEYQPSDRWNVFAQGMVEMARINKDALPEHFYDNKRNSFGYFCGVEYLPFKDQDLRFFLAYIGRQSQYQQRDLNTHSHRFSLGMMYRIKAF